MIMMLIDALHEAGILRGILDYLTHRDETHLLSSSVSLGYLIRNYRGTNVCSHTIVLDGPCLPKHFTATISRHPIPYIFPSLSSYQYASKIYQNYFSQLYYVEHLYIKHTRTNAGFGVYSDCTIPKDSLLFFYEGECLRSKEVQKRRSIMAATNAMNYVLTVNEKSIVSSNVIFKTHYAGQEGPRRSTPYFSFLEIEEYHAHAIASRLG